MELSTPTMQRDVFTPSRLNAVARGVLEDVLTMVWVEGEISNFLAHRSGHWYFTLKDSSAQVRCAMFKSRSGGTRVLPRDGMQVLVRGRVTLYEARGEYQLVVEHLEESGEGALRRAFDALKAKLAEEGLFDAARKRALPRLPRRIAILSSPTGAAIRDVLSVLRRRLPLVEVDLVPVAVQGEGAAAVIATKLCALSAAGRHDVILLTRGGGSLEDLWAFNDEALARAIAASAIPVVSAIGHEVDFSISDFVADLRAATPSAAAELLVPDARDLSRSVSHLHQRLLAANARCLRDFAQRADRLWLRLQAQRADQRLRMARQRLAQLKPRLWRAWTGKRQARLAGLALLSRQWGAHDPRARLQRLRDLQARLFRTMTLALERSSRARHAQLTTLARTLHAASPLATLARGYSILTTAESRVVRAASEVAVGDRLDARLARGALSLRVESLSGDAQSD